MKLKILKPNGWCAGVKHSVEQLEKIITKHSPNNVYLLGDLVHNRAVMSRFKKAGVHIVNDFKLIKHKNSVIVFPAHGTPTKQLNYARANFKHVYNLTCKILLNNYKIIKKISRKFVTLYYGYKDHPESKAILSLSNKPSLVSSSSKLKINKQYALVNQSTIPLSSVKSILNKLKFQTPHIKHIPTTCSATQQRHNVITHLHGIDCLFVCGDEKSNNTIELVKLSQRCNIPAALISNELEAQFFKPKKNLRYAIISGTSVEPSFFKAVCTILKNKK
ncbi:4-hydroxy-3-methylbut-2-enyl diphosphate reductase [Bacilli bacterium]|nr:4-hydroxy-3-methylbut-2-enyl diphosphate reductase [Bacilli bacterium]